MLKKGENTRLYAVSVNPPDVSKTLAEKLASDGKGAIDFQILSDVDHKIIDAYRLRDPAYEKEKIYGIPHPAVYVIDKTGKVAWARIESDYRKRPLNSEIRVALDALK